jgi:UDP-N-acetylglucosamine/UDP-N-acetylgalactosamine 4-epimerase
MFDTPYHRESLDQYEFLVTGGAGFIGSNLVEYLLKYNAKKVLVLDNLSNGFKKNIEGFLYNPSFEFIEGDIRDLETCRKVVTGIDFVLHQAALGSVPRSIKDPITSTEVNVNGFLNIVWASKDAGVKKLIYAASSSTYGDSKSLPKKEEIIGKPLSPYAITKYINELYAENIANLFGFESVGLRYFNVFGPKQDPKGAYAAVIPLFIDALINGTPPVIFGDGEQTRDFTFIENVIQANIKAIFSKTANKHEVYNVACGENISVNNLFNQLNIFSGKNLMPVHYPERTGDVRDSLADISKARNDLGYEPNVSISEGLKLTYDWFLKNVEFINIRK